jgi:hypothetical protein
LSVRIVRGKPKPFKAPCRASGASPKSYGEVAARDSLRGLVPQSARLFLFLLLVFLDCGAGIVASDGSQRDGTGPTGRRDLLLALSRCLADIPKTEGDRSYNSPCAGRNVAALSGIKRSELVAALGPPTWCQAPGVVGKPQGADCLPGEWPVWSFYSLARIVEGGGPELVCESDKDQRCARLSWFVSL